MHLANQAPNANIYVWSLVYLPLLWWLVAGKAVFKTMIGGWKDFMFWNEKFPGIGNPYNLFEYLLNKDIDIETLIYKWIHWRTTVSQHRKQKIIFAPKKERRYQYVKCLSPRSLSSSVLPTFPRKLKIIAYRESSTIPTSPNLELLSRYGMTSWHYIATKSFITDNVGVWDLSLVSMFSV